MKKNKLAVFDFDSTLMDGETIDFLAAEAGALQEVAIITQRAMAGELDFYESLKSRVSLLQGMPLKKAEEICFALPLMNGAFEIVEYLKKNGYKIVIFSGGFSLATSCMRKKLHLDADFSNILHHKNGVLSGEVGGEMMFIDSKGSMLERLQSLLSITKEHTLVVGDGANDVCMCAYASKSVAFCAKPALKEHANIIVDSKDLALIIPYLIEHDI